MEKAIQLGDYDIELDNEYLKRQRHSPVERANHLLKENEQIEEVKSKIRVKIFDAVFSIFKDTAHANTETIQKYGRRLEKDIKKVLEKSKNY